MSPDIERMRTESEVFGDLARLASSPGYAHVIAAICFRDTVIPIKEEVDSSDIAKQFSDECLLKTEISTLIGLMVKSSIDFKIPEPHLIKDMIDQTDRLLHELHLTMIPSVEDFFQKTLTRANSENPFTQGNFLREPIFYSGESAFLFQYRDLSVLKYSADNKWMLENRGFYIDNARAVVTSIIDIQNEKLMTTLKSFRDKPLQQWTMLPAFKFSTDEIVTKSGLSTDLVCSVLASFTLPDEENNSRFRTVSDFNITNALPLLPIGMSE